MELRSEKLCEPTSFGRNCMNGNIKSSNSFKSKDIASVDGDVADLSVKSDIPVLLKLIEDVYNQRLLAIENNDNLNEKEKTEEKLVALKSYVHQLQDQNDTFASTMIELEKEAQQRVKQMEKRLKSSAKTTMEAVISMNECEREMRRLVEERLYIESLYRDTRQHLSSIKLENSFLRDQNFNLNHDVQALLHVIHHARSTGHWEMDCVTFCEVTPEQVFGPVQSISQIYSAESESQLFDKHDKKGSSTALPSSVCLPKCVSLPEIGNIYSNIHAIRKSSSYEAISNNLILGVNYSKEISNNTKNSQGTTELLKDMSLSENHEQIPCIRKGQSEPHLFMFNDNVYKYRPCESLLKTSETALNENYQSSLPPYQSIDLKFPTNESTLKICAWNKLKNKSYADTQENSIFKDTTSNSSFSFSESEIKGMNKHMLKIFGEQITSCLQNEKKVPLSSIGLQTESDKVTQATQVEMNDNDFLHITSVENNLMQVLKENLIKAENKAEEKGILIEQLQSHLTTAVKEVELKDKVLVNLEKKLETSRNACLSLKNQVDDLNSEIQLLLKDLEETRMLNTNFKLQMEQQSQIIRTLQEALVQSKRAFDAAHPKLPLIQAVATENLQSRNHQSSKGSIVDI